MEASLDPAGSSVANDEVGGKDKAKENGDHDKIEEGETASGRKHRRSSVRKPRTKGLVKKLQEQIDFYFGDSNLSKDRFLHHKIKEGQDRYVAVDVIASFKKMQSLTTDRSLIIKAMHNSSMVELSPDNTKVRRCHPLPSISQEEIDSRTIYVEKFPAHVQDHEMVSKMFKQFGEVSYVSLPRFKATGSIKGFAFIEFSAKEAAEKAVEYFRVKDALPPDMKKGKPSKVLTALSKETLENISEEMETSADDTFIADSSKTSDVAFEEDRTSNNETKDLSEESLKASFKETRAEKRNRTEEESQDVTKGDKKFKCDLGSDSNQNVDEKDLLPMSALTSKTDNDKELEAKPTEDDSNRKRSRVEGGSVSEETVGVGEVPAEKRHKISESEDTEEGIPTDKEMDNAEERSKEAASGLVQSVSGDQNSNTGVSRDGNEKSEGEMKNEGTGKKKRHRSHRKKSWGLALRDMELRVMSKMEWSEMKETFKNLQKSNFQKLKAIVTEGQEERKAKKGFVKDCLVKVELHKECEEKTKDMLKELCEKFGDVAFFDLKEGDTEGYVRYKSSGCVENLVQSDTIVEGISLQAMKEEDERAYYTKTVAERKQTFKVKKKKMNQRGKDKLISKVLKAIPSGTSAALVGGGTSEVPLPTHIKFEDSDNSDLEAE